jgi:phage N-6-adenine-methyltransferase
MSLPKDERETPPELFKRLDARFAFTLDACAAPKNALLPRYNSLSNSDSAYRWAGERVFANPPYSDIRPWVEKALAREAELTYLLLPNWTDRKWWQEQIEPVRDRGLGVTTEFMPRARFLVDGKPIRNKNGQIGQPEFGLVGVIIT